MRCLRVLLSGGALVGFTAAPVIAQEVRSQVTARASAGYQSNPFLQGADVDAGPLTTIEIDPSLFIEDEDSLIEVTARTRFDYFPDGGNTNDSVELQTRVTKQANERLELNASARFFTSRNAVFDAVFADPDALIDDLVLPDPTLIDTSVVGEQFRTTTFNAELAAGLQLSPVSSANVQVSSASTKFDGAFANDFAITRGSLQYMHAISQRTNLGVVGDVAYSTFDGGLGGNGEDGGRGGDALFGGASGVAEIDISETGKLRAQAGFSVVNFDLGALGSETNTVAVGNISFCERVFGGSLCLTGARNAQPIGIGGIATVSSAGFGWTKQINRKDTLSFSARYSIVQEPELSLGNLITERRLTRLFGISPSYSREIRSDLRLFATANYSDVSGGRTNVPNNYGFRIGISKTFGGAR